MNNCRFRVFGDPPSQRAAEDIAFSTARFFSKNGTLTNYYMVKEDTLMLFFELFLDINQMNLHEDLYVCSTMVGQILVEQPPIL